CSKRISFLDFQLNSSWFESDFWLWQISAIYGMVPQSIIVFGDGPIHQCMNFIDHDAILQIIFALYRN
ncbi:unnamed protein product, partial [Rotaria sp. Silwood1]